MTTAETTDVAEMREAFFRKTHRPTQAIYAGLGVAGGLALVVGLASDALPAILGAVIGLAATVALLEAWRVLAVSQHDSKQITKWSAVGCLVLAIVVGNQLSSRLGPGFIAGLCAGLLLGVVVGIARLRRRLAWDDELMLRHAELGLGASRRPTRR